MNAMNDASCRKCGKRFGWPGKLTDRPACPRCGDRIPAEELEAEQINLDRLEKEMLEEIRKRPQSIESVQRRLNATDPDRLKRRLDGARQARELIQSGLLNLDHQDKAAGFLRAMADELGLPPEARAAAMGVRHDNSAL